MIRRFQAKMCPFCEGEFTPRTGRQYTCGAEECQRERRRLCCERWYKVNQEQHIENVQRMRKIREARKGQGGAP